MAHGRSAQLQIPTNYRPGHVRSTSTSSIARHPESFLSESPPSQVSPPIPGTPFSPQTRPDVPPNSAQAFSGMATPALDNAGPMVANASMTTLLAGESGKPFKVLTDLLTSRSPYFRELFGTPTTRRSSLVNIPITASDIPEASDAILSFPDLNEFAMSLFNRWLYGAKFSGPTDFHTMQHYLCLYVLADRFQIEKLENEVMDLTRAYYRSTDMSSPPYRLEYIYENTDGPNKMREFLVATAVQKAVEDGEVGKVMKDVLGQGGELCVDFIHTLVERQGEEGVDVRGGKDCVWHRHEQTRRCKIRGTDD